MEDVELVIKTPDVKHTVSEDNVATRSKRRDNTLKEKKSNRTSKEFLSKDLSTVNSADEIKSSKTLEHLNKNTEACLAGGRRRVRSADSAIFANKRKRRMVKKQVVGVIEDLENVIYEINSVTTELRGVLNQIDRVTSHLELSVDGLDISEDNIFLKSSKINKKIQDTKQRSVSCASLATLNRYKPEITTSTQTYKKYKPTRYVSKESMAKDKESSVITELSCVEVRESKNQNKANKSSVTKSCTANSEIPSSFESYSQLASSRNRFPSNSGSLAASVSSMTGILSSSLNSLNSGYNTSLEDIDFGINWRNLTSPGPCVTADSSYRTLSETNSLYFEDLLLQNNNNPVGVFDCNTNNVTEYCTCDKEFKFLSVEKSPVGAAMDSPSLYRHIFSTTSRRSRSTTGSVSSQVSCYSNEDLLKDFSADYNRDINTWTTFAMVHIDADELGE